MRGGLLPALGALLLAVPAQGTDLYYSDFTEKSPNGRYVLEARSPENRGKTARPFAGNFRYTFRDRTTRKVLWTAQQGDDDLPLTTAAIHDSGWIVAQDARDHFHCIAPDGRRTGDINLLGDAISKADVKRYVHDTSAGPIWAGLAVEYFVEIEGRLHYAIRPWWGHRVLIDVSGGKAVRISRTASAACLAREREEALRMLREAVAGKATFDKDCCEPLAGTARLGAYLAGALDVREAIPLLRQLEDSRNVASSTTGFSDQSPPGKIAVDDYEEYSVRRVVHLALRRLGESPGPFAILRPSLKNGKYDERGNAPLPKLTAPRHKHSAQVRKGRTPEEVFALLSGPDFIETTDDSGVAWEYDMDDNRPYTLRIVWKNRVVADVERLRPALWQDGLTRDEQIAN